MFHDVIISITLCLLLCPFEEEGGSASSDRVCVCSIGDLQERERSIFVCVGVRARVCGEVVSGNSSEEDHSAACLPKFDLTS